MVVRSVLRLTGPLWLLMVAAIGTALATGDARGGDMLAFRSDRHDIGGNYQLFLLDMTLDLVHRLTRSDGAIQYPSWSPDGRKLVYQQIIATGVAQIHVLDLRSGKVTPITTEEGWHLAPTWSPDSRQIAYVTSEQIHVYDLLEGAVTRTYTPLDVGSYMAWSPDGTQIAYMHREALYLLDVESGDTREVIRTGEALLLSPAWSPDGTQIAFGASYQTDDISAQLMYSTVIMDANGENLRPLVDLGRSALSASWLPDGEQLVLWTTDITGNFDIYRIDADGTNLHRLTDHPADDRIPRWRP